MKKKYLKKYGNICRWILIYKKENKNNNKDNNKNGIMNRDKMKMKNNKRYKYEKESK